MASFSDGLRLREFELIKEEYEVETDGTDKHLRPADRRSIRNTQKNALCDSLNIPRS